MSRELVGCSFVRENNKLLNSLKETRQLVAAERDIDAETVGVVSAIVLDLKQPAGGS